MHIYFGVIQNKSKLIQSRTDWQSLSIGSATYIGTLPQPSATNHIDIQFLCTFQQVWAVCAAVPEVTVQTGFPMLLVAWSITEILRYNFYAQSLFNCTPNILRWLRYSTFIVLYPLGISGELLTMYAALPYIVQRKLWTVSLPNAANIAFSYYAFMIMIMVSYIPIFPQLYGHMLAQRRKALHPNEKKSA